MTRCNRTNGLVGSERAPASPGAPAWIYHRRGDRAWRCHQTGDFLSRDTALRRLRTSGGRAQPLDGVHRSTVEIGESIGLQVCQSQLCLVTKEKRYE